MFTILATKNTTEQYTWLICKNEKSAHTKQSANRRGEKRQQEIHLRRRPTKLDAAYKISILPEFLVPYMGSNEFYVTSLRANQWVLHMFLRASSLEGAIILG